MTFSRSSGETDYFMAPERTGSTQTATEAPHTDAPSSRPRTLRNVLSNWTGTFVSLLITFFLSPFIVQDRKSTRLNSSHVSISYAVFCLKKKKNNYILH